MEKEAKNSELKINEISINGKRMSQEEALNESPNIRNVIENFLNGNIVDLADENVKEDKPQSSVNVNLNDEEDIFKPLYPILDTANKLAQKAPNHNIINTGYLLYALLNNMDTTISKSFSGLPYNSCNMLDILHQVTKFSFFSETLKNKVFNYDCSKEVKDIIYTAQLFHEICPEADVLDVISKLILSNEQTVGKLAMTNLLKSNILKLESNLNSSIFNENSNNQPKSKIEVNEKLPPELINLSSVMERKQPVLAKREKELRQLQNALCKMEKPNALLVGPAGIGKSAIVEYLAYLLQLGKEHSMLAGKKIYQLNLASLVSGARYVGDLEEKFIRLMKNIMNMPNAIIFIDEAHTMVGAGKGQNGNNDVSQLLKPYLARDDIRMIGATTEKEYNKIIKPDEAFARRFQIINVLEPSVEDTIDMVSLQKAKRESFYNIVIDKELIPFIVDIASKKIQDNAFPDKAITLLDNACVLAVENRDNPHDTVTLTKQNIEDVFAM